ncbi:MAG TPA: HIT family protein [Myxococcales bacterium]|nr:HIT family protein [Myxococcales bacterium]
MDSKADCVFCRIVKGELPASIVYEDGEVLAFMDMGQVNPGHVLVTLKEHAADVFGLDDAQSAAVFRAAARVARAVRDAFQPDGLALYQANGTAAGQTVFHFHLHVLPRSAGDGIQLAWRTSNPPRAKLDDDAARIRTKMG